jgi:hypothetical protein
VSYDNRSTMPLIISSLYLVLFLESLRMSF